MAYNPHQQVRGGLYTFCSYSGIGSAGDIAITVSGQNRGRLNSVVVFNSQTSGGVVTFYDGANVGVTLASGGPFATSGHVVLYQLPIWPNSSAVSGQFAPIQTPVNVDVPFFSGLNVATRSGTPGFTVSWTVEKPLY